MSEPKDNNMHELLQEKIEELASEVKDLSDDLEEKKKWQKITKAQGVISIKQVEYFLELVLRVSFDRNLQKRVDCLVQILKQFRSEFKWYNFLGGEYLEDRKLGADDLQRAELRFHRNFEKLAGVFLKVFDSIRETKQIEQHHHRWIFECLRDLARIIPFKFCF